MAYRRIGDDALGVGGGGANRSRVGDVAAAAALTDYEINAYDVYEETAVARDKRVVGDDITQYRAGSARKRTDGGGYERSGDVVFERRRKRNGGAAAADSDFGPGNKYYEDVHVERARVQAEQDRLTPAQQSHLKNSLRTLVQRRSSQPAAAAAAARGLAGSRETNSLRAFARHPSHARPADDDDDDDEIFVPRSNAGAGSADKRDRNDYDWVVSGTRSKREFQAVGRDTDAAPNETSGSAAAAAAAAATAATAAPAATIDDDGDDEYIVASVPMPAADDEWVKDHTRRTAGGGGGGGEDNDNNEARKETLIQVSRREVRHMQKLAKRLYGSDITEQQYVNSVRDKMVASTAAHTTKGGGDDAAELDIALDDERMQEYTSAALVATATAAATVASSGVRRDAAAEDDGAVSTYGSQWQRSFDADSMSNIPPDVQWRRTVYGRTPGARCAAAIDPLMFVTTRACAERLIDEPVGGVHTVVEAQIRRHLRHCGDASLRVFDDIAKWCTVIDMCDVTFAKCKFYTCKPPRGAAAAERGGGGGGDGGGGEKRMVLYHDMKNGFFVCNHFVLREKRLGANGGGGGSRRGGAKKTPSANAAAASRYDYEWISHCYIQYVNAHE